MGKKNQRARYLLNVPDLIHHERLQQNGKVVRCHLITEDVSETKRKYTQIICVSGIAFKLEKIPSD